MLCDQYELTNTPLSRYVEAQTSQISFQLKSEDGSTCHPSPSGSVTVSTSSWEKVLETVSRVPSLPTHATYTSASVKSSQSMSRNSVCSPIVFPGNPNATPPTLDGKNTT